MTGLSCSKFNMPACKYGNLSVAAEAGSLRLALAVAGFQWLAFCEASFLWLLLQAF